MRPPDNAAKYPSALVFMFACSGLGLALLTQSCSLILDWDPNALACDTNVVNGHTDFCVAGYTCLTLNGANHCIANHSRALGHPCSAAQQCQTGQVCPQDLLAGGGVIGQGGVATCLAACDSNLADAGIFQKNACETGYVCQPYLDRNVSYANKTLLSACLPADNCTAGATCTTPEGNAGGVCVAMGASTNACLLGCEVSWSSTLTYSDNCNPNAYCQPVGLAGQQEFACIYNGGTASVPTVGQNVAANGSACEPVSAPCQSGSVCSPQGTCAKYCELTTNTSSTCPAPMTCCPFNTFSTSQTTGFCSDPNKC